MRCLASDTPHRKPWQDPGPLAEAAASRRISAGSRSPQASSSKPFGALARKQNSVCEGLQGPGAERARLCLSHSAHFSSTSASAGLKRIELSTPRTSKSRVRALVLVQLRTWLENLRETYKFDRAVGVAQQPPRGSTRQVGPVVGSSLGPIACAVHGSVSGVTGC